jgi:hypothetical protein
MLRPIYTALHLRRRPDPTPDNGFYTYKSGERSHSRRKKQFEWLSGFTQTGHVLESDSTHQLHGEVEDGNLHNGISEGGESQEGVGVGGVTMNGRGTGANMHPMGIVVKNDVAVEISAAGYS